MSNEIKGGKIALGRVPDTDTYTINNHLLNKKENTMLRKSIFVFLFSIILMSCINNYEKQLLKKKETIVNEYELFFETLEIVLKNEYKKIDTYQQQINNIQIDLEKMYNKVDKQKLINWLKDIPTTNKLQSIDDINISPFPSGMSLDIMKIERRINNLEKILNIYIIGPGKGFDYFLGTTKDEKYIISSAEDVWMESIYTNIKEEMSKKIQNRNLDIYTYFLESCYKYKEKEPEKETDYIRNGIRPNIGGNSGLMVGGTETEIRQQVNFILNYISEIVILQNQYQQAKNNIEKWSDSLLNENKKIFQNNIDTINKQIEKERNSGLKGLINRNKHKN